jgi:hypothetical protein
MLGVRLGGSARVVAVDRTMAAVVAGGSPGDLTWAAFGRSTEFAGLPVVAYWLATSSLRLGEEVGWRGFLQLV